MRKRSLLLTIFLIGVLLILSGAGSVSFAYSNKRYLNTCTTGGTTGCLDKHNGSILNSGDIAITITSINSYFHTLKISGCGAESDPTTIIPDSNPGTKCWVEVPATDMPVTIGSDGQILVSNSTVASWVSISGDISITNVGVVSLSADSVGTAEMADEDHGDIEWVSGFVDVETVRIHAKVNEAGGVIMGQAVYISGATGDKPQISLADNTLHISSHTLGVVAGTAANNADVDVILFGELIDVDTSGFTAEGDRMHLSTSGSMQSAIPTSGAHIHMGFVTKKNVSTGIMIVRPEAYVHDMRGTSDIDVKIAVGSNDATRKILFEKYDGTDLGYMDGAGTFNWGTSNAFNITTAGVVTGPSGFNGPVGNDISAVGAFTTLDASGNADITGDLAVTGNVDVSGSSVVADTTTFGDDTDTTETIMFDNTPTNIFGHYFVSDGGTQDDMTTSGSYTGEVLTKFRVRIDGAGVASGSCTGTCGDDGTCDTFEWSNDNGISYSTTDICITKSAQLLENGVSVTFADDDGHTGNAYWDFNALENGRQVFGGARFTLDRSLKIDMQYQNSQPVSCVQSGEVVTNYDCVSWTHAGNSVVIVNTPASDSMAGLAVLGIRSNLTGIDTSTGIDEAISGVFLWNGGSSDGTSAGVGISAELRSSDGIGAVTYPEMSAFETKGAFSNQGTITDLYGVNILNSSTTGLAITNNTGINVKAQSVGTNNYGINLEDGSNCIAMDDVIGTLICNKTVTLTASQINNSRASPVELVATRGAGTLIELVSLAIFHDWAADFTVGADEDLIIRYDAGAGPDLTAPIETDGLLDNVGADTVFLIPASITTNTDMTAAINKKIEVFNTGTGEIADGSGSVVDFKISYNVQII